MSAAFAYVRDTYGVPAAVGRRVIVDGKPGVIAEDRGHYIGVNFDANKPGDIRNAHPTWKVEYLEMGAVRPMTRSQRRYGEFLDADTGLTFGEWLKARQAPRDLDCRMCQGTGEGRSDRTNCIGCGGSGQNAPAFALEDLF